MKSIIESLKEASRKIPSNPVYFRNMLGKESRSSYGSILKCSVGFAQHLRERGFRKEDKAVIILSNCPEFLYAFFGTIMAGGYPVPVAPPLIGLKDLNYYMDRVSFILNDSNSNFLITTRSDIPMYKDSERLDCNKFQFIDVLDVNYENGQIEDIHLPDSSQVAFIQYTSGSTGTPKGVALTHENIIQDIKGIGKAVDVHENECVVTWLPLYHDMGIIGGMLLPVFYAATLVIMPTELFVVKPVNWLLYISQYKATLAPGNNFTYDYCVKKVKDENIKELDLSSWRVAFNGSEPIDINVVQNFYEKFKNYGYKKTVMLPCYGLAEATLGVSFIKHDEEPEFLECNSKSLFLGSNVILKRYGDEDAVRLISVGKPIENLQIRIFDHENKELEECIVGRIGIAGPTVMKGYLNGSSYIKELINDKWLITGDIGFLYNGNLYITGREKDMIIIRGKNYSLVDIENALSHLNESIENIAAFSYFDSEESREALGIVIETQESDYEKNEAIKEKILMKLSNDIGVRPKIVIFTMPHTIPRTMNGKIRRNYCAQFFLRERCQNG